MVARELVIDGTRFAVQEGGRKLIRVPGDELKQTPKKVQISGIDFYRTKKGNLARANTTTTNRLQQTRSQQCETFTKHGTCPFGPSCKFAHNPKKIAICKDFLHTGTCRADSYCDLSHEPTYHRAPACTHFLRGNCTNDACRYPHVNTSASAPVCRAFATLGYCSKGSACCKRHVTECPDYANKGHCPAFSDGKCSLPHIDRASALRKAAKRLEKTGSEEESDLSSEADEEEDDDKEDNNDSDAEMEEVDSDGIEDDIFVAGTDDNRALTQQKDFVPF
ncbi:hypothetical protein K431DRAFT_281444 [Polychaeton citri CBS 116435]|uniref:C3H1-type domain-containing protein n=1 Tax=Polychaeton citri CBS 116435 TaxID=1314669 RepID=A0A9P4QCZ1_9PEZI|nr:hypothetical protein K431DRAFT_281444 [Polychaeton citri CBS 116435]